ncbi:MAG: hypothetical protein K2M07_03655 [Muribaculaceae bacterium]|nr:hypothetical protein [Muribaculaceae bacterium]
MEQAKVTRLDVGVTLQVNNPVETYYSHLGELPYSIRSETGNRSTRSLYYKRNEQIITFYDKDKENRQNRGNIPEQFVNFNNLRYEQRYLSHVSKQLGISDDIKASELYNPQFIEGIVTKWVNTFKRIKKVNMKQLDFRKIQGFADLSKILAQIAVTQYGGVANFLQMIEDEKRRGHISPNQYRAFRRGIINACCTSEVVETEANCMGELETKICEAAENFKYTL